MIVILCHVMCTLCVAFSAFGGTKLKLVKRLRVLHHIFLTGDQWMRHISKLYM